MSWIREFGGFEWLLLLLFGLLYALFIRRNYVISRRLGSRGRAVWVKLFLRSAYFTLILMALLGPSFGDVRREVRTVGKDIYIVVDLSRSMDAHDVSPSRIERAKFEIKNLISNLRGDRLGLIVFSYDAFLQCPLTYDQNALQIFVDALSTNLVPEGGTDMAPPLKMALEKHTDPENPLTQQQAKIILLISDGEDFGEATNKIADEISSAGIRLFALGIGTEQGGRIPSGRGYKLDREGREVVSRLNSRALRQLAGRTDGKYFEITDQTNEVRQLQLAIDEVAGELRDTRTMDASANQYALFLIPALLLVGLDLLFTVKIVRL